LKIFYFLLIIIEGDSILSLSVNLECPSMAPSAYNSGKGDLGKLSLNIPERELILPQA
jgi:hypothetical protein